MKTYFKILTAVIFLALSVGNNAYANPTDAQKIYKKAETNFSTNNFERAIELLDEFFKKYKNLKNTKAVAFAYNLRGLVLFQSRSINEAIKQFQHAVELSEDLFTETDEALHLARFNLAKALQHTKQSEKAFSILDKIDSNYLDKDIKIRFFHLLGNNFHELEKYPQAVTSYLLAANKLEEQDSVSAEALIQQAYSLSDKLFLQNSAENISTLKNFKEKLRKNAIGTWTLELILAQGFSYIGNKEEAKQSLQNFLENALPHPLTNDAEAMLLQFRKLSFVEPTKIGLLLPLSGKFSKYGKLSLNSTMLALKAFKSMRLQNTEESNNNEISLVVRDSGDSAQSALDAFEKLVTEDHVISVIGPLLSRQAIGISRKAQEYGIPLFNLSQKQDLDKMGPYVFPIALSPKQQIDLIVKYTTENLGYKKFAILAPNSRYGNEYVRLFWDAIESQEAKIVGFEQYIPGSTDFRLEIKKLIGLHYIGSRALELEELKRREEVYGSTLKARGKLRKRLLEKFKPKAQVDFDALFIPDGPIAVGQIAPSFAVYGLKDIPFIGIHTWNTPEIIKRAGKYLQKSFFVDAFFPSNNNKKAKEFITSYSDSFSSLPATLEVQAYDAAKILIDILSKNNFKNRSELQRFLVESKKLKGISGSFTFTESGTKRTAYLLKVNGSDIVEISQ